MGKKVWAGVILVAVIAIVCISATMPLQNEDNDSNTGPVLAELEYVFHLNDNATAEICRIINKGSATKLVIPEKVLRDDMEFRVISIADRVFYGCDGLTGDLVIPDSIESIGGSAFFGCRGFDGKLILGDGLRTIGIEAFAHCGFRGDLTIPDSIESIGDSAFLGCEGFDGKLVLGNGLQMIEKWTFLDCRLTGSLIIPDNVKRIGFNAFGDCKFSGNLKLGSGLETVDGILLNEFKGNLTFDCGNLHSYQPNIFAGCYFDSLTVLKDGFILGSMNWDAVKEISIALDVTDTNVLSSKWNFYDRTRLLPPDALPGYTYILDDDKMVRHGEFN